MVMHAIARISDSGTIQKILESVGEPTGPPMEERSDERPTSWLGLAAPQQVRHRRGWWRHPQAVEQAEKPSPRCREQDDDEKDSDDAH